VTVIGTFVGIVVVAGAIVAYCYLRSIRQARALERAELLNVAEAVESTTKLQHTAALVTYNDFAALGSMVSYETLRGAHQLQYFDSIESLAMIAQSGRFVVFISHQWTSWQHPDPTNTQYKVMVAAVEHVAQRMGWDLNRVLVWADYCAIPQSNESEQLEAIKSLPGYVSCATAFVIVAPTVRHSNKEEDCDLQSYRNRMWCRVEQLCFLMAKSADAMFVATGEDAGSIAPASQDTGWLRENLYVFEGVATDEGDKIKLVTPLLGLYATMLLGERERGTGTNDAALTETQRLFRSVLSDTSRPLFPRTVTVDFVLRDGERTRVPNPKREVLFGNLPQRTSQLVQMTHEMSLKSTPSATQSYADRFFKAANTASPTKVLTKTTVETPSEETKVFPEGGEDVPPVAALDTLAV